MSIFDWFRAKPPADPAPRDEAAATALRDAEAQARRDVRAGYLTLDEVREQAVEAYGEEVEARALTPMVAWAVDAEARAIREEQRRWPAVTDHDRLQAAFATLEADRGIVARENFTCCNTCGHGEIGDEIAQVEQAGLPVRGYAFFHAQDTEAAVEGHGLFLSFGAVDGTPEGDAMVARDVVATLEGSGLAPEWDGDIGRRVFLPLDWKRRI